MKHVITVTTAMAALTLFGASAHASCADPRAAAQQGTVRNAESLVLPKSAAGSGYGSGGEGIVGTWHVTYTVEGAPFAQAFIQWHSDGTEWENINLPLLGGNICVGSWKQIDRSHFSRNHIGWMYSNGTLIGYFTETETDVLAPNGASYRGTNDQKIYDLTGALQAEVTGTSSATRIWP